jgi:hypothetical protein
MPPKFFSKIRSISPEKVVPVRELSYRKGHYHSDLSARSQFAIMLFQGAFQPPMSGQNAADNLSPFKAQP